MKTKFFSALAALTLSNAPLHAETALERVLSILESNPSFAAGNVHMNISRNSPGDDAEAGSSVDSSVYYYEAPPAPDAEPSEPLEFNIKTTSVGATNTGLISAIETTSLGNAVNSPDNLPSFTTNAAVTEGPVYAFVSIETNAPRAASSEISTSAIGAVNSGQIKILIENSKGN